VEVKQAALGTARKRCMALRWSRGRLRLKHLGCQQGPGGLSGGRPYITFDATGHGSIRDGGINLYDLAMTASIGPREEEVGEEEDPIPQPTGRVGVLSTVRLCAQFCASRNPCCIRFLLSTYNSSLARFAYLLFKLQVLRT